MSPKFISRLLNVLLFFAVTSNIIEARSAEKSYFQTRSGDFVVKWSDKNLTASTVTAGEAKQPLFSARTLAQKERPAKKDKTTEDRAFTLLSVVGPILSFQDERTLDWPGMAHPGVGDVRRYVTIDLRYPQKSVSLTDYLAANDIYVALMSDKVVKLALKQAKAHPRNLTELSNAIRDAMVFATDQDGGESKLLFMPDLLKRFCFDRLTKDGAGVSLSLYDQEGNQIKPLSIVVPVKNSEIKQWLQAADQNKEGVLSDRLKSSVKDAETDFHFDP